jgi:two-component system OmpR family response regulator
MVILLVEDDAKISSFITKGLKQAGYSVKQASDGEDGLHYLLT